MIKLFDYIRSSAAYRVRIALNLKQLNYQKETVNLKTGEQFQDDYKKLNPQSLVPSLLTDENVINQSIAILEYLEEHFPNPAILPTDSFERARVRSLALLIACDVQPFGNVRPLFYLRDHLDATPEQVEAWGQHWVMTGFSALEKRLNTEKETGEFCHGNVPTMADICLVPQVASAERFNCDLSVFPTICRIASNCHELLPFANASAQHLVEEEAVV